MNQIIAVGSHINKIAPIEHKVYSLFSALVICGNLLTEYFQPSWQNQSPLHPLRLSPSLSAPNKGTANTQNQIMAANLVVAKADI